ncbi:hypothetical protein AAG570_008969 [Ranatra chinensis]|uniref:Uncharacterized protein n=1 Tax=Ranatra chinensis TaxID=642074 RepID=A0ABD0Z5A4_9HEMI
MVERRCPVRPWSHVVGVTELSHTQTQAGALTGGTWHFGRLHLTALNTEHNLRIGAWCVGSDGYSGVVGQQRAGGRRRNSREGGAAHAHPPALPPAPPHHQRPISWPLTVHYPRLKPPPQISTGYPRSHLFPTETEVFGPSPS